MDFDLAAYRARTGAPAVQPTAAGLAALHLAHLRAIPFENIDPLLGATPDLTDAAIWDKLVVRGRGGYCFEQNLLFGAALRALGFDLRPVLARVRMGRAPGPRSHLAWIAAVEGREYVADVGFGGSGSAVPLARVEDVIQTNGSGVFRIVRDTESGEQVITREQRGAWLSLYGFDDFLPAADDIGAANVMCAQGAESPFPRHLMMNIVTPDGRAGLFDTALTVETADEERKTDLPDRAALRAALVNLFRLPDEARLIDPVWDRLAAAREPA